MPILANIWEDLSMNFIMELLKVTGTNAILVVIDRLNKYNYFIVIRHSYTTKDIVDIFVKKIVRLYWFP